MVLRDVVNALKLTVRAGENFIDDKVIEGGYVGDLLSHVMAKAGKGQIWVTVQSHPNIIAVAVVTNLCAIIVSEDMPIDPMTIKRAEEEEIPLFSTKMNSFETVLALAEAGVKNKRE